MISYSIIQKSQFKGALRLDAEYFQKVEELIESYEKKVKKEKKKLSFM